MIKLSAKALLPERVPLSKTVWAWPVIGGPIGAFSTLLILVLALAGIDLSLAVLWVVAAQFLVTGALHEDGLMDSADGLFGGRNPERRLAIMRDGRVGSYGVLAGVLATLGKWSAYLAICRTASFDMVQTLFALASTAAFGRLGMVQLYPCRDRPGQMAWPARSHSQKINALCPC
ncbi:MAG: adenosylcobinamide-GDP ribazoletransferase [Acetobacteraceae bacterium]